MSVEVYEDFTSMLADDTWSAVCCVLGARSADSEFRVRVSALPGSVSVALTHGDRRHANVQVDLWQGGRLLETKRTASDGWTIFGPPSPGPTLVRVHLPDGSHDISVDVPDYRPGRELQKYLDVGPVMAFLPIVDLRDSSIAMLQAVARDWDRRRFPTALFEEAAFLGEPVLAELELTCLRGAIEAASRCRWVHRARLMVCISPSTLLREEVIEFLERRGLPLRPGQVIISINGQPREEDQEALRSRMDRLFLFGYGLCLDDAGMAPDRLGQALLNLRPQYLKLDRHYVETCLAERRFSLLETYVRQAMHLGGYLIIEGAEASWGETDLGHFYRMGIPYAQGTLFGPPRRAGSSRVALPSHAARLLARTQESRPCLQWAA